MIMPRVCAAAAESQLALEEDIRQNECQLIHELYSTLNQLTVVARQKQQMLDLLAAQKRELEQTSLQQTIAVGAAVHAPNRRLYH